MCVSECVCRGAVVEDVEEGEGEAEEEVGEGEGEEAYYERADWPGKGGEEGVEGEGGGGEEGREFAVWGSVCVCVSIMRFYSAYQHQHEYRGQRGSTCICVYIRLTSFSILLLDLSGCCLSSSSS